MGACSFVVGSDGYLYQGRGWHWVGAHTKGYNSKGYGVGYVGDFSATLPDPDTIALVRDWLLPCAVRTGRLHHNYTLRGHRQMGHTDCPGNSLFHEIETWQGFEVGTKLCGIFRGWRFGGQLGCLVQTGTAGRMGVWWGWMWEVMLGLMVVSSLLYSEDQPCGSWSGWVRARLDRGLDGSWPNG